jgi:hypothetical protein
MLLIGYCNTKVRKEDDFCLKNEMGRGEKDQGWLGSVMKYHGRWFPCAICGQGGWEGEGEGGCFQNSANSSREDGVRQTL